MENKIDAIRLENLCTALDIQVGLLKSAYESKNYINMSECASNIEKLSYTINYLNSNVQMK